jgi:predicted RNA-binding protein with PIN domain
LARALLVARAGEAESPPVRPPDGLRPLLGFARLHGPALSTLKRVVDTDLEFRERVVAATEEADVGRAGWLWLTRPEGWAEELDALVAEADHAEREQSEERDNTRLRRALAGAEDAARRHEAASHRAREAEARAVGEVAAERAGRRKAERGLADAKAEIASVSEQRADALRSLDDTEAALAMARRDLRVARTALREAEQELAARHVLAIPDSSTAPLRSADRTSIEAVPDLPGSPNDVVDPAALGRRVAEAAAAASALSAALAEAAAELGAAPPSARLSAVGPADDDPTLPAARPLPSPSPLRSRRRPARLPPGVRDDVAEAAAHLMRLPGAAVLVDGYNVARTAWSDLAPEEERNRLLAMLDEVQSRTGADVIVVFDGLEKASGVTGGGGRSVRVRFTAEGVTADEVVLGMIDDFPVDRPVIVVSSDREVAEGGRARGANVVSSRQFLAAVRR